MTEPQILYSPEGRADLLALETYIAANDGEAHAELIIARIDEAIHGLAFMPGMGRPRAFLDPHARAFAVSPWIIVYELLPDLDGITILRIIDGRRDLNAVFGRRKKRRPGRQRR